jgi:hypothetical protein
MPAASRSSPRRVLSAARFDPFTSVRLRPQVRIFRETPMSTIAFEAPLLKPLPDGDFVWDFSKGADHSKIVCADPIIRIKSSRNEPSPGRSIGIAKKNSRRNTIDYLDPIDGAVKRAEGSLEMKGIYQDFRDPDVVKIEPQFGPCHYVDKDGNTRPAYWDARVTYADGMKVLKDFKPASIAAKRNHVQTVKNIFVQMPRSVADSASMITDRDLPAWAVANGRLIHSVLCDEHWVLLDEMATTAAGTVDPVTLEEFCRPHGGIGRTFRTAVYLIAKRKLWHRPGLIDATTRVASFRSTVAPHA